MQNKIHHKILISVRTHLLPMGSLQNNLKQTTFWVTRLTNITAIRKHPVWTKMYCCRKYSICHHKTITVINVWILVNTLRSYRGISCRFVKSVVNSLHWCHYYRRNGCPNASPIGIVRNKLLRNWIIFNLRYFWATTSQFRITSSHQTHCCTKTQNYFSHYY